MWMDAHRIPLCVLDRYLSAFFPPAPRDQHALERYKSFFNPAGSLRIFVREAECAKYDMLRLVRHKLRFRDFTINFESLPGANLKQIEVFKAFVNNDNPEWLQLMRAHAVRQLRINWQRSSHIVIKEMAAPLWLKSCLSGPAPDDYLKNLGLSQFCKPVQRISFGIDYS